MQVEIQFRKEALQLYQYRPDEDPAIYGQARGCAWTGCPAVAMLVDAPDVWFTDDWVLYHYANNLGMQINHIVNTMSYMAAMMNRTGVGNPDDPRRNLLQNSNMGEKPPRTDKFRTMSLNAHTGTETYNLLWAIRTIFQGIAQRSFRATRQAMAAIAAPNLLRLTVLDGRQPPPMKINPHTGLPYPRPRSIAEVVPEHYLYTPPTHRPLFVDLTNVKVQADKSIAYGPWSNGLVRPWIGDNKPHTFFPLVTTHDPISPLSKWIKLPLGSAFPSPFRQ